ncbi:hypothetical protein [Halopiger thermotolerans]
MIGRNIGQRLLTVVVVVGLLAMAFGVGAATADEVEDGDQSVETNEVVENVTVETSEAVENVSVQNESTQTVEESVTETETSFSSDGGDAPSDVGEIDFGDDFMDSGFATDIVDQTLTNVDEMFD